jgi:N-acetylmuramoyl-L-alanine amidase
MKLIAKITVAILLSTIYIFTTGKSIAAAAYNGKSCSIENISDKYGLFVKNNITSNAIELVSSKTRIKFIPGIPLIICNNRSYRLSRAPYFYNGSLYLPQEVTTLLPKIPVIKRKRAEYFKRINTDITVLLDPGHGGKDPGAIGVGRIREKDVNLSVALYVSEYLKRYGVKVVMTRSGDTFPTLGQRAQMANRLPNSIFVSIHANSCSKSSVSGIETFVLADRVSDSYRARKAASKYSIKNNHTKLSYHGQRTVLDRMCKSARTDSVKLANLIQRNTIKTSGDENRGVRRENLHVLRENYFSPAVLVEVGFLSHRRTARKLRQEWYLKKIAMGISEGIVSYLKLCNRTSEQTAWNNPSNHKVVARR